MRVVYVLGNSYIKTLNGGRGFPNPLYGVVEGEPQFLGYEIDTEDVSNPVWLGSFSESVSMNIVIFEPIYFSGGRLNVDKYKRKPKRFSLQGSIEHNNVLIVEKYRAFIEALFIEPEYQGGIDPTLSKERGVEVPAFYIKKLTYYNTTLVKTQILRAICEEITFEPDQVRKFRRLNFSATLTALNPRWEDL